MNQPYFGLENVIVDSKLSNVRSCIIFRLGESLTPFNKKNHIKYKKKKKKNEAIQGVDIFENTRKNFKSNLILKVFLILRCQGLQ